MCSFCAKSVRIDERNALFNLSSTATIDAGFIFALIISVLSISTEKL